ncbi:MAG: hypothetical protein RML12_00610 [Xanthomonadales bacterium]|nr:hypothetical protein [Xanthomonadales bacterium]
MDRSGHAPEAGKAAGAGAGHDTAAAFDLSPQQKAILDEEIERLLTPRQDATPRVRRAPSRRRNFQRYCQSDPRRPRVGRAPFPKPARDALPAVLEQIVARLLQAERRRAPFEILMVEGKPLNGASPIAQSLRARRARARAPLRPRGPPRGRPSRR